MSPQSQMIDRRESSVRKRLTALFEATDIAERVIYIATSKTEDLN